MQISRPEPTEYHEFYANYINGIDTDDVLQYMKGQKEELIQFIRAIPDDRYNYAYSAGKWTIKQLLRHMIDAERMFAFRAMSIARGEQAMLPGFNEQIYAEKADDSQNTMNDLIEEFDSLRSSNIQMISNLTSQATERTGNANGSVVSVRAIIFVIAGHVAHHKRIITERYLEHV